MPTTGQLALLIVAIVIFGVGGFIAFARLWTQRPPRRPTVKSCLWLGLGAGLAVLAWHSLLRGSWLPLDANFDTFIWLGVLLGMFLLYIQRHKPLGGLDWFVIPIIILMFLAAALTEPAAPRDYVRKAWLWAHRITMFIGAMAFLLAAAVGAMYLINNRRLRHKHVLPGPDLGSLERLEKLTLAYVSLGFALLTIGMILGLAHYKQLGSNWFANPKFVLGIAAWVVYALVLHSPINPAFRGRRAALLSIIGFLLIFGVFVFVVVQ